jgi:hypothetical protein
MPVEGIGMSFHQSFEKSPVFPGVGRDLPGP